WRAAQPDDAVAALDADAGRGAAGAHTLHGQAVVVLRDLEAEPAPREVVGAGRGERRRTQPHLVLLTVVAAAREADAPALGMVLAALLELLARADVAAVDLGDRIAGGDPRARRRAVRLDLRHHHAVARAEVLGECGRHVLHLQAEPGVP